MARLDEALAYDYDADDRWQSYFANVDFVTKPTEEQLNKLKRKWYKKNVDSNYEAPTDEAPRRAPSPKPSPNTSSSQGASQAGSTPTPPTSSSSSSSSATSWGPRDFAGLKGYVLNNKLRSAWVLSHVMFLTLGVWSLVPFIGGGDAAYRRAFQAAMLSFVLPLAAAHGKPRFDRMYLEGLLRDTNGQFALYCIVFMLSDTPFIPALLPLAVYSVYHTSDALRRDIIPALYPNSRGRAPLPIEKTLDAYRPQVSLAAAQVEVLNFVGLILLAIGGLVGIARGSIMPAFGYYQFVRIRYMLSPEVRTAVYQLTSHPRCPGLARRAADWLFAMPAQQ